MKLEPSPGSDPREESLAAIEEEVALLKPAEDEATYQSCW